MNQTIINELNRLIDGGFVTPAVVIEIRRMIDGWVGENIIRKHLERTRTRYFQADIIEYGNGLFCGEVKHQERFVHPDGHGLPPWQFNARLEFQRLTGIRAKLYIVEKPSDIILWQYFDILQNSNGFLSPTGGRIIFPIEAFERIGNNGSGEVCHQMVPA